MTPTILPTVRTGSYQVTPGALLGSSGAEPIAAAINASTGAQNWFMSGQSRYAAAMAYFQQNIITPLAQVGAQLAQAVQAVVVIDEYRTFTGYEDFKRIPQCMQLGLVTDPRILELLRQGRVSGFGYDPDTLRTDDPFGQVINSGFICDVAAAPVNEHGYVTITEQWNSYGDPTLTQDEKDALYEARRLMHQMLDTTAYDPTAYPMERG